MSENSQALEALDRSWTVLLTTYKRDGTAVGTPVNLAVDGDVAYFRSYDKAWKTKRLARNPSVELAPCSVRGNPRGPAVSATARLLEGDEIGLARRALARRHPVFHRFVIPLAHRISRYLTLHYEVIVTESSHAAGA
jgi:PPOX class probable F420-dependent enzyme